MQPPLGATSPRSSSASCSSCARSVVASSPAATGNLRLERRRRSRPCEAGVLFMVATAIDIVCTYAGVRPRASPWPTSYSSSLRPLRPRFGGGRRRAGPSSASSPPRVRAARIRAARRSAAKLGSRHGDHPRAECASVAFFAIAIIVVLFEQSQASTSPPARHRPPRRASPRREPLPGARHPDLTVRGVCVVVFRPAFPPWRHHPLRRLPGPPARSSGLASRRRACAPSPVSRSIMANTKLLEQEAANSAEAKVRGRAAVQPDLSDVRRTRSN